MTTGQITGVTPTHRDEPLALSVPMPRTGDNLDSSYSAVVLLTGLAGDNYISIGLGGLAVLISLTIFVIALVKRRRYPGKQVELRGGPVEKPLQISLR